MWRCMTVSQLCITVMTQLNLPIPAMQLLACQSHPQTISGSSKVTTPVSVEQTWNPLCPCSMMFVWASWNRCAPSFSFPPIISVSVISLTAFPGHCPTIPFKLGSQKLWNIWTGWMTSCNICLISIWRVNRASGVILHICADTVMSAVCVNTYEYHSRLPSC